LIFLSEEDSNFETRQLNNDEDEKENVAESVSDFASRNK
jgi:hypothetical protein